MELLARNFGQAATFGVRRQIIIAREGSCGILWIGKWRRHSRLSLKVRGGTRIFPELGRLFPQAAFFVLTV
jgi:hypothetical protein